MTGNKERTVEQDTAATSADERRTTPEAADSPRASRVREDDLEPHAGLRYIARLFKALAILLIFMLIGELVIGLRQDGTNALGTLLIEATRLIVFAGFLWGAGDMALMLIESNHDLRATRILVGRLNTRLERVIAAAGGAPAPVAGRSPGPP